MLKKKNVTNPTNAPLNMAMDKNKRNCMQSFLCTRQLNTNKAIYLIRWITTYYRRRTHSQRP
jgi:hypothetical protein